MTVYKVSIVVADGSHPGAILNLDHRPIEGETININGNLFLILEVIELMPPRGKFQYLHLTCIPQAS
ncbi:MAG TPA: hypothetical protein VLA32_04745 [Anaerolineales bacterium]|jgi:hypothetical protein|nr:hypothetical protein [Anaerolineales bacterium]